MMLLGSLSDPEVSIFACLKLPKISTYVQKCRPCDSIEHREEVRYLQKAAHLQYRIRWLLCWLQQSG